MAGFMSYLSQLTAQSPEVVAGMNNLQNYNSRMDQDHMNKVFAANPQFAQQLYGAQNQQALVGLQKQEMAQKMQQQSALKALAVKYANQDPSQPFDRQSALAQYGAITGDLSGLLGMGGGNIPAPIQIANEIARRRAAGDTEGALLLEQAAKLGEKGTFTAADGTVQVLPGYAPAIGTIAGAKADAGNISDMTYDPITAGKSEAAKLAEQLITEPAIAGEKAAANVTGAAQGDAQARLANMQASMPALQQVATKLSALGKAATYTVTGQARDSLSRQLGFDVPDSATARAEYMATVDNEILPLLRQTFGAAFTQKEGESLKATLGDPDKSPPEKDAALKAFIEAKQREVQSLQRQVAAGSRPAVPAITMGGVTPGNGLGNVNDPVQPLTYNPVTGEFE